MIRGILFFESGDIQQIGDLRSLEGIIQAMREVLPDFEKKETERIFKSLNKDQITQFIKESENTEKLEP